MIIAMCTDSSRGLPQAITLSIYLNWKLCKLLSLLLSFCQLLSCFNIQSKQAKPSDIITVIKYLFSYSWTLSERKKVCCFNLEDKRKTEKVRGTQFSRGTFTKKTKFQLDARLLNPKTTLWQTSGDIYHFAANGLPRDEVDTFKLLANYPWTIERIIGASNGKLSEAMAVPFLPENF